MWYFTRGADLGYGTMEAVARVPPSLPIQSRVRRLRLFRVSGGRWAAAVFCIGTPLIVCGAEARATAAPGSARAAVAVHPRIERRDERVASDALVADRGRGSASGVTVLGGRGGPRRALDAFAVGIAITGLLTTVFGIGERRWRQLAGLALFLLGLALYGGCDYVRRVFRAPKASASGKVLQLPWRSASE